MPRPKRARVTPSAPVITASRRAAAAENAQSSTSKTRPKTRKPLTNLTNTASSKRTNSDSSDAVFGLVKNAPKGSRRQGGGVRDESAMMAGGLGEGEAPFRKTKRKTQAMETVTPEEQEANEGKAAQASRQGGRVAKMVAGKEVQESNVRGLRSRKETSVSGRHRRVLYEAEETGLNAQRIPESEPVPEARMTLEDAPTTKKSIWNVSSPEKLERITEQIPSSVQRARMTPGGDTSILALGNWKRRPRQPSVVRTAAPQLSDHDIEDSFQLPVSDDFDPDDESTPTKLDRADKQRKSLGSDRQETASPTQTATSSPKKRKRSPPPVQIDPTDEQSLPSSPPSRQSDSPPILRSDPVDSISHRTIAAPQDSKIPIETHPQSERAATPDPMSETQAPPLSSSPLRDSPAARRQEARRSSSPLKGAASTRPTRQANQNKRSKRLTTAELTSLLPQRRVQRRAAGPADFEILSLSENDDTRGEPEDDGEGLAPRRQQPRKSKAAIPTKKSARTTTPARRKNKAKTVAPSEELSRAKGLKRTYGRQSSDKENEDGEDKEPSEFMREIANGDGSDVEIDTIVDRNNGSKGDKGKQRGKHRESLELSEAAKKFAKVDEWEMEFESVETGGRSSSPWR